MGRTFARSAALLMFSALGLVAGCAKIDTHRIVPGKSTDAEVTSLLGPPEAVVRSTNVYPDGVNVQFDKSKVVNAVVRNPAPHEREVQFWRHLWKGHPQFEGLAPSKSNPHGRPLKQLVSRTAGMAVIFDNSTGVVERVIQYGSH